MEIGEENRQAGRSRQTSIKAQCLATLFIPIGLYAFKRIGKFRQGILTYVIGNAIFVLVNYGTPLFNPGFTIQLTVIVYAALFSYALPMVAMKKWSSDYNKKLNNIL